MRAWRITTSAMVLMVVAGPFVPALTTWSPTSVGVLIVAALAIVAYGLVAYFDWRMRLKLRGVVDEQRDDELRLAA